MIHQEITARFCWLSLAASSLSSENISSHYLQCRMGSNSRFI